MTDQALEDRVAILEGELEVRRRFALYPRLYGPMALLAWVFAFLPLLEDVREEDPDGGTLTRAYGTLWEIAGRSNGSFVLPGVLISLVTLLVIATRRVRSRLLPIAIAVLAAALVAMLLGIRAAADPAPDLASPCPSGAVRRRVTGCASSVRSPS